MIRHQALILYSNQDVFDKVTVSKLHRLDIIGDAQWDYPNPLPGSNLITNFLKNPITNGVIQSAFFCQRNKLAKQDDTQVRMLPT